MRQIALDWTLSRRWGEDLDSVLVNLCEKTNLIFINNYNVNMNSHLNKSKLHLNREGTGILANNFLYHLGY